MIQLSRKGTICSRSAHDLQRLRDQFECDHHIRMPRLLGADLLRYVHERSLHAEFETMEHRGIGVELRLNDTRVWNLLFLLTNDPALFQWIEQVTGCGSIGCFMGRVYRMVPGAGHYDRWHTDATGHRMVGMSINLGPMPYEGGRFVLRDSQSGKTFCEIANTGPGDAILFRIRGDLEHHVTAVEGTAHKTAFAGWFQSEPKFLGLFQPAS